MNLEKEIREGNAPQGISQDDWAPIATDDPKPKIPEGEYVAFCNKAVKHHNRRYKRDQITLALTICEGKYARTKLERYFPADTAGRPRSNYNREWTIANNGVAPRRADRMPLSKFKDKLFSVRVKTVVTDASQEKLPAAMQYSKVSVILGLLQSNEMPN